MAVTLLLLSNHSLSMPPQLPRRARQKTHEEKNCVVVYLDLYTGTMFLSKDNAAELNAGLSLIACTRSAKSTIPVISCFLTNDNTENEKERARERSRGDMFLNMHMLATLS